MTAVITPPMVMASVVAPAPMVTISATVLLALAGAKAAVTPLIIAGAARAPYVTVALIFGRQHVLSVHKPNVDQIPEHVLLQRN
jgi:hypothetical protein